MSRFFDRFITGPFFIVAMFVAFAAVVLLTSCAAPTPPREQQVVSGIKTEIVYKSVLEPCVFEDEIPKVPGTWMSETQTKEKRRLASRIDDKAAEEYILAADSILRGCAKPRPTTEVPK